MQPFASALEAGGVEYKPITFSCFGRPHPDAVALVRALGRRIARRRGTEAHIEERRLAAHIGVEIWRRAARMLRQCMPNTAADAPEEGLPPLCAETLRRVGPPDTTAQDAFS